MILRSGNEPASPASKDGILGQAKSRLKPEL